MSETTVEFSILTESLPKGELNRAVANDELYARGAYCAHCNEVHDDLRFKKLLNNVYVADCPREHNFILLELVEARDERDGYT